jgi:hypothetical protein
MPNEIAPISNCCLQLVLPIKTEDHQVITWKCKVDLVDDSKNNSPNSFLLLVNSELIVYLLIDSQLLKHSGCTAVFVWLVSCFTVDRFTIILAQWLDCCFCMNCWLLICWWIHNVAIQTDWQSNQILCRMCWLQLLFVYRLDYQTVYLE